MKEATQVMKGSVPPYSPSVRVLFFHFLLFLLLFLCVLQTNKCCREQTTKQHIADLIL